MKNYQEVSSCGRGAGTDKPLVVAFQPSTKFTAVDETIRVFDEKGGLSIRYLPGGGKPVSGFIKRDELWDLYRRIDFAYAKRYEYELNPAKKAEVPYIFKMGNGLKGKSPEQCLLEGMEQQLLAQREYMAKNCTGKFAEANRAGVEAIDRAFEKKANGALESEVQTTTVFTVFDSNWTGPKYIPKRNVPQPYQTEGWEMNIVCSFTDNYPWKISFVSKTVTVEDNVITASSNPVYASVSLTAAEFDAGIKESEELFRDISYMYRPQRLAYQAAHKDDWKANKEGYC